ncbi:MAG: CPBP family intramembrane metalloprotease [Rubrobacter sp.]|nr:CPBP family intramembrane metalloprotease [Rubrobacter sp.]
MASASRDLMGPRFVGLAAVFYGTLFLAGVVISALRDRHLSILGRSPFLGFSVGVVTACGTVALALCLYRFLPVVKKLSDELGPHLIDRVGKSELILVSVLSGVGEETFFRGALQPELRLIAASVLFGALLHVVPEPRFFVWTLLSVGAGFLFWLSLSARGAFGPDDGPRSAQRCNAFVLEAFPPCLF